MDRHDDPELDRDLNTLVDEDETHATTGGAAAAGAVTGGVIGLTGGPIGAAIGAVGGAIIGAAAERMMHSDDNDESETSEHARPAEAEPVEMVDPTPIARQPSDRPATPAGERTGDLPQRERKPGEMPAERWPG
jgi:phage tail tape-measure protein